MVAARRAEELAAGGFSSHRSINRKLCWLAFDERVLAEADNPAYPTLEWLRFLSTCANNLYELYIAPYATPRAASDI